MLLNLLDTNGLECPQANMQGHEAKLYSNPCQPVEQFRRKMQPGSRSGHSARLLRIHRLVAFLVCGVLAWRALDIRRQRDFSVLFYTLLKILFRKKAHTPLTGPRRLHPLAPKFIRKINASADFLVLAAFTQDLPGFSLSSSPSNEEEFDFSASLLLPT